MSSELRIQASRINDAKSHGPKTPRGKSNSSRNHTKHGMLSKTIILEGEAGSRFAALPAAMREELQPQTPIQDGLVENMAACRWRQRRLWAPGWVGLARSAQTPQSNRRYHSRDPQAGRRNLRRERPHPRPPRIHFWVRYMTASSRALDLIS